MIKMSCQLPFRVLGCGEPLRLKEATLLVVTGVFMVAAYNTSFFAKVLSIYPPGGRYLLFHTGVVLILVASTILLLALVSSKYTTKPCIALLLNTSSVVSYFVNQYGIVVDADMLRNIVETNVAESIDLLTVKLFLYFGVLGVLPSLIVWRLHIDYQSIRRTILTKGVIIGSAVSVIVVALLSSSSTFASFLREHKSLRPYVNPIGYVYAVGKLVGSRFSHPDDALRPYATDATLAPRSSRRLVIVVVGETARADRFSLNGYARETNPLLKREAIVNFTNVMSAGTSTAVAVPSMFSHLGRENYNARVARHTENILDILARLDVSVLWRDNNSDSKGVAARVPYEDCKTPERNPVCDIECRDEGMLVDLQAYLDKQPGDVLVVLHTMGSHGPAYYKRYPKSFEVFKPVRETNQLEECTTEELNNAYDNTILYTDYFLSKVITLLKRNDVQFDTAMLYFSDHGESLGENRMYLHGYPYALAPIEQKHIPAIFWFGESFPIDLAMMRSRAHEAYSHDNLFHTLLGLFDVQTNAYQPQLDMVRPYLVKSPLPPK